MEVTEESKRIYSETRKDLLARLLYNAEAFDKAILSLSSAGLGISLAFIKDIVPIERVENFNILYFSWLLFAGAIIFTIISFVVSQEGVKTQLRYVEKYYLEGEEAYLRKTNWPAKITEYINWSSGIFFILAIILTVTFVSINIGESKMSDKDTSQKTILREGAIVPNMQKVQGGDTIEKGATIPSMQPVPQTQGGSNSNSNQGSSNQSSDSSNSGSGKTKTKDLTSTKK